MKKIIGYVTALLGAILWVIGGFKKAESYDDLKAIGKLGYRTFIKGLGWMGIKTQKDFESFVDVAKQRLKTEL